MTLNPSKKTQPYVLGELLTSLAMGGAENLAIQIANMHAVKGNESHLIVLSGPGPMSDRVGENVHVHYLGYQRASIRNPFKFLFSIFQGFGKIRKIVKKYNIEVVQTHLPDANLWGLVLAFTRQCSIAVTIHNNVFFGGQERNSLGKVLLVWAYRLIFRYCSVVMCSEEVRDSVINGLNISEKYRKRVYAVTNGVMPAESLSENEVNSIRAQWGVGPEDTFLLAAGRFTDAKNFQCLLNALASLKTQKQFPKLLIGGDGLLRPDLEKQIEELGLTNQVQMPGNLANLPEIMGATDCLVMPSRWEGLPLVLLEAMMRERPVVGTRIKGIADTIEDGVQGFLVTVDNPSELAEKISRIIDDPEESRAMGRRGRKRVEERYSFERVYNELDEVFRSALGANLK